MTGSGVESPSHWISSESGSTPLGRLTLQLSVYEVPATPDPSPDTTTTDGATGATMEKNSCPTGYHCQGRSPEHCF